MRPARLIAVARRDLRLHFAERRGGILPAVAGLLMAGVAFAPSADDLSDRRVVHHVVGDLPPALDEAVASGAVEHHTLDEARELSKAGQRILGFKASETEGEPLQLIGSSVPNTIREALDAADPSITVEAIHDEPWPMPERSVFLAFLAASVLTGALAQALPGERSQRTLEALLTAAITPLELLAGKWLAWGGFGALAGLVGCVASILAGHQEAGWWLLAVPWVPLGTAALGFLLVRRAADVVGGSIVALRTLPVVLFTSGLLAWWLGSQDPWLGALVPVGGALLAAGDTWPGLGPVALSVLTTALATAWMLWSTARRLGDSERSAQDIGLGAAFASAVVAAAAWWTTSSSALLWVFGGAPERTEAVGASAAPLAGSMALACLLAVVWARSARPRWDLGLTVPPRSAWAYLPFALGLGALSVSLMATYAIDQGLLAASVVVRMTGVSLGSPGHAITGVAVLLTQEVVFRGWIRRQGGDVFAVLAFTVACFPLDPFVGLTLGTALGALTRLSGGSLLPAVAARLVLWVYGSALYGAVIDTGTLGEQPTPVGLPGVLTLGTLGFAWVAYRLSPPADPPPLALGRALHDRSAEAA